MTTLRIPVSTIEHLDAIMNNIAVKKEKTISCEALIVIPLDIETHSQKLDGWITH